MVWQDLYEFGDEKVDLDACTYYFTAKQNLAKVLCFIDVLGHRTFALTLRRSIFCESHRSTVFYQCSEASAWKRSASMLQNYCI